MANKEFKIQSGTVSLNGVNLSASADGNVVLPGVTKAAGYQVEEVNDTGNQTIQWNPSLPIYVLDNAELTHLYGDTRSNSYSAATYTATLDDNGYIDEVVVGSAGLFDPDGDYIVATANTLSATQAADPINNFNINDWQQIPFRPQFQAGSVESEPGFGGQQGPVARPYAASPINTQNPDVLLGAIRVRMDSGIVSVMSSYGADLAIIWAGRLISTSIGTQTIIGSDASNVASGNQETLGTLVNRGDTLIIDQLYDANSNTIYRITVIVTWSSLPNGTIIIEQLFG